MMKLFTFQKPTEAALRQFLAQQAAYGYTYSAVGATAHTVPEDYVVDRTRVELGEGAEVFDLAKAALQRWEHFRLGWVDVWPADAPLVKGEVVAIMGRMLGIYSLNSCRIVYTIDESQPIVRYGYAYGTLPGHIESGEERFLIEWDMVTNKVFYDIIAFSRPNYLLAWLIYPVIRYGQKRFVSLGASKGATHGRFLGAESLNLKDWPLLEPVSITLYRHRTRWALWPLLTLFPGYQGDSCCR